MKNGAKPIVNPFVRLREEFDDWAILFDCDTGHGFGLSPTGVYVWKLLDGEHSIDDLLEEIRSHADDVPEEAIEHVSAFIDELAAEGLAGFGSAGSGLPANAKRPEDFCSPPCGQACELSRFKYEPPKLVDLSGRRQTVYGDACTGGSSASVYCSSTGNAAQLACHGGLTPGGGGDKCDTGTSAGHCHATGNSPTVLDCVNGNGIWCCEDGLAAHSGCCVSGTGAGSP